MPSYLTPLARLVATRAPLNAVKLRLGGNPLEVKTKDLLGRLPLHWAAWNEGSPEVVGALLVAWPEAAEIVCQSGCTALHYAAWGRASRVVFSILLKTYPLAAQLRDRRGILPLHLAVESKVGPEAITELLMTHAAALQERTRLGLLPLHVAISAGASKEVVSVITLAYLKHRCFPTPQARELHNLQMDALRSRASLAPLFQSLQERLFGACRGGNHASDVTALADHGVSVNVVDAEHRTPLHIAAQYGHVSVVRSLLELQAQIEATTYSGDTPMHMALLAHPPRLDVLKLLLDFGANINGLNVPTARTPLMMAVLSRELETVRLLLARGAALEAFDRWNNTPLLIACAAGLGDMVAFLLSRGARMQPWEAHTHNNAAAGEDEEDAAAGPTLSALMVAVQAGQIQMVELLLGLGADVNARNPAGLNVLMVAVVRPYSNRQLEMVSFLCNKGAIIESANSAGLTPLMLAARASYFEMVDFLVSRRGARLEAVDSISRTPLMIAASASGATQTVATLLALGASVNAIDAFGQTALHHSAAALINQNPNPNCLLLVENGADPGHRDLAGRSALDLIANDHAEAVPQQLLHRWMVQLEDARGTYLAQRRDQNWARRRAILIVAAENGYRPLLPRLQTLERMRALLESRGERPPPTAIDTPERRRAYFMGLVLGNNGLFRLIASFL